MPRRCVSPPALHFLRGMLFVFCCHVYVLLSRALPFDACCAFLALKESGMRDRHTSLALHSIQLKNFGPFREEVRPVE